MTAASDPNASPFLDPRSDAPIRAELYGLDRLETLARHLASASKVDPKLRPGDLLLRRFAENGQVLQKTHKRIIGQSDRPESRGIDADWLADNFHIVDDVLREIKQDLPSGYYSELPKLSVGPARNYPRVYSIALALVAHTDGEIDENRITRFLQAYQSAASLQIGEVWAVPTMLRLVLVENLRRLADRMVRGWDAWLAADRWASTNLPRVVEASSDDETSAAPVPDPADASTVTFPSLTDPFVVRLIQILRERGASAQPILHALEAELARQGKSVNAVLREEHRRQAANQVSVGNCVISLRLLSVIDWNLFFEKNSNVEVVLRGDPAGIYSRQDFATRDRYRRVIEQVARRSNADEESVARKAIELAAENRSSDPKLRHVGYYIVDEGRPQLRGAFRYRTPLRERAHDWALHHSRFVYFGSIAALTAALIGFAAWVGVSTATMPTSIPLMALLLLALAIPATDIAVGLINNAITLFLPPRKLARLDFKAGIPADDATIIVVPSMLVRRDSASQLLERLEITYLANPDANLRFALLTDFADAPEEHRPEDDSLIRSALDAVAALNARYPINGQPRFYLFHRKRTWNETQGRWMGWERKRGKLSEFNRLIRGDRSTHYDVQSDDPASLPHVRFVITLDADTILPRESARRLVGTMAHPLNAPHYDPEARRVVSGYGVLQPRVSYHLFAATRSRFAGLLAASAGIDPYSNAISDAYMDLFGLGSFTGKGIYELDAFEAANGHTFPENSILSHDLIEGNYARCGLVTDVELFDDFPPRYHAYALREHRWARGDWQLLPWLGMSVPTPMGRKPSPLPLLERWKMLDNLRRSLVPPALVLLLILGWTVLPGSPIVWTIFALAVPALPIAQLILGASYGSIKQGSFAGLFGIGHSFPATAAQSLLWIALLADQARRLVDAIIRTLYRLFVSRKNLLEWETAAAAEHRLGHGIGNFFRTMWTSPAIALAAAALIALVKPYALVAAAPVLVTWFLAPLLAYWISRPKRVEELPLDQKERAELRRIARKTWHFFETFVGEEDHWLPPDNYQEDSIGSGGRVAHRTSPTNKGMLLLSTLSAHDLGYLDLSTLVDRLHKTFDTFDRLEKHRGHLYNWYNTQTLRTLPPNYVSTVDSGNLLGCLVTLKQGMREKVNEVVPNASYRTGLVDTLDMLAEDVRRARTGRLTDAEKAFDGLVAEVHRELNAAPGDLASWSNWLLGLADLSQGEAGLIASVRAMGQTHPTMLDRWEGYAGRFDALVADRRAEIQLLAPWASLPGLANESAISQASARSQEFERIWSPLRRELVDPAKVSDYARTAGKLAAEVASLESQLPEWTGRDRASAEVRELAQAIRSSKAGALIDRIRTLGDRSGEMADGMDFSFLYKDDRHLFSIGLNMAQGKLDASCYDLMASEAALSSFLAVARGDAPRRHWFQLGRPFIEAADRVGLLSWGGSMFEYLMPRLMMLPLKGTLLDQAHRTAIARQMEYGRQMGVPWGISESAYAAFSVDGDYHYQSFGTPGLGLKRDIGGDLVIAPYATALAVAVQPREALANFARLAAEGGEGRYGFHEAVDFTPERVPVGKRSVVVRSYMAHHHGMGLVALANALLDEPMPRRFHAEPMIRAADLLLQERIPRGAPIIEPSESEPISASSEAGVERSSVPLMSRRLSTPTSPVPRTHLLSNGQYNVMVTNSGAGYSACRGIDLTRWREDTTRDSTGFFVYVRDVSSDHVWSVAHQPTLQDADHYEAIFSADKAAFRRLDGLVECLTEITVSPESRAEIRRITITNHDTKPREVELTSYAEVVLLGHGADLSHPAFGKLFLETEWASAPAALLCRRRPRGSDQAPVWAIHVGAFDGSTSSDLQYETDRAKFLGRGRTTASPAALDPGSNLSGTVGAVLDPIFSIRRRIKIDAGMSASVAFALAVADSRDEALTLADHYRDLAACTRAFELAWATSQVEHRSRNWTAQDAHAFQRLGGSLLYVGTAHRAGEAILRQNRKGQPGLWPYGISGDKPIVLAFVGDYDQTLLATQLLTAHTFLRLKGLEFDLVFLTGASEGSTDDLSTLLMDLIRGTDARDLVDQRGGVFVRKLAAVPAEDRILLESYSRAVFRGEDGSLMSQLDRAEWFRPIPQRLEPSKPLAPAAEPLAARPVAGIQFDNGYGGFAEGGREYVVRIPPSASPDARRNGRSNVRSSIRPSLPPAPWVNVIANSEFGCIVSESGGGYTWSGNSQTNRLTTWANDPVSDACAEVLYVRDDETGAFWNPTPLPVASGEPTMVRHGQGYTRFERSVGEIEHRLTFVVDAEDPVKVVHLSLQNHGKETRELSAFYYLEWVLGSNRDIAAMTVWTERDADSAAILARNPSHPDFPSRIAFLATTEDARSMTADRTEFLGRNGTLSDPAALARVDLGGAFGAGSDPCGAIQVKFNLAPGSSRELVFLLGAADSVGEVRRLVGKYREPGRFDQTIGTVRAQWDRILSAVEVETPDPSMNLILNRWLPYQALSCRFWGRSATYQSGGAFGFRDQLQDSMALVYGAPAEAREQIIRASARQFVEGDVQHWWHPPLGKGVRTRITDDLVWLPYVACHYVETTGDSSVLDVEVPFLQSPELRPGQEDDYGMPPSTELPGSIYEHCCRALDRAYQLGPHGLPLIGTGDWNDGMNKVGERGRGESVWNGWFLIATLRRFAPLAASRGDENRAKSCTDRAEALRQSIESQAWDGQWYRRAYFDDGTPLGSAQNAECQIDSIAQSWAAISEVAQPDRVKQALDSVDRLLVKDEEALILLFSPPFDQGKMQPGYVRGYVPGVRENGGQYTHAATWMVLANAMQGRGQRAVELFHLLNPINHAASAEAVERYKVEPYVVAADVYGRPPHVGRGGWTWYTGSASWLYRVGLEAILGFHLKGDRMTIDPRIARDWHSFSIRYRHGSTTYDIHIINPDGVERGVQSISLDGRLIDSNSVPLVDDQISHKVEVRLG